MWSSQILTERGHVGAKTKQIVNALVPHNLREVLVPEKEFWTASKTLNFLLEGPYFKRDGETNTHWPKALKDMMDKGTPLVTGGVLRINGSKVCSWIVPL